MDITGYSVHVRKRVSFLKAMMDHFCGSALISFEGDLSAIDIQNIPNTSTQPTGDLRRNTFDPQRDFIVLPLEAHTIDIIRNDILHRIGLSRRVDHILIAQDGKLVVGIYDRFDEGSVWVSPQTSRSFLDSLAEQDIINSYTFLTYSE
ncbi:MAG: hypothetical protein R2911_27865 [Caldilineaceae bacterium]